MNKPNNCICCNKELEIVINKDKSVMFAHDGTHQEIVVGYGSCSHDGEVLEFSICDSCITEKIKNGNIFIKGDFFEKLSEIPKGKLITPKDQKKIDRSILSCSFKFK